MEMGIGEREFCLRLRDVDGDLYGDVNVETVMEIAINLDVCQMWGMWLMLSLCLVEFIGVGVQKKVKFCCWHFGFQVVLVFDLILVGI